MKDKNVTISLSEYKDLLLKERPSDNDKWLLEKFKDFLASNAVLNGNNIEIKKYQDFEEKTLDFIKMIDFDFYKQIVKKCYDNNQFRQLFYVVYIIILIEYIKTEKSILRENISQMGLQIRKKVIKCL